MLNHKKKESKAAEILIIATFMVAILLSLYNYFNTSRE